MKITFHFLYRKTSLLFILCLLTACQSSKDNETKDNTSSITRSLEPEYRIEPPNWWIGFKNTQLQLMVHKKDIGNTGGFMQDLNDLNLAPQASMLLRLEKQ